MQRNHCFRHDVRRKLDHFLTPKSWSAHAFGAPWAPLWSHLRALCSFLERVPAAKPVSYGF